MTQTPPSEDASRDVPPPDVGEVPEDPDARFERETPISGDDREDPVAPPDQDRAPAAETDAEPAPAWEVVDPDDPPQSRQDSSGAEQVDEDGLTAADQETEASSSEEVFLFAAPAGRGAPPSPATGAAREMGWKMMAAVGVLLLAAGFATGLFFPDLASREEAPSATTAATVPAADSATTSTAAPSPATTVPAAAPATTAAPTTEAPATTAAEVEIAPVEPPKLVITDEPVADVANRLMPSVVHLEIRSDDLFEQGAGSGVIFDSDGYILTAAHVVATVVDGEAELTVRLSNGDRLPGEVVGTDPDADIAVVKVDRGGLTPAELSLDEPPRVGQLVVAVGSPWGLESSVTSGVISAVDRIVEGKLLVQSDAVLYPGNSGGALADRYGRLIGINVSIFTDSTTLEAIEFQGVGFAVPMDVAHRVAQALVAGEPVYTAFLGISGRDTQGDAGVEIMEVFPGSGAEEAGLRVGDVVVGVGGRPVTGITDLAARIRHRAPGDVIILNVLRDGESRRLVATLLPRSEVMTTQDEQPLE